MKEWGLGAESREEKVRWQKLTEGSQGEQHPSEWKDLRTDEKAGESCSQLLHDFLVRIVLSVLSSLFYKEGDLSIFMSQCE